eukprot:6061045-Heterocapsa_arctica.AAC.1
MSVDRLRVFFSRSKRLKFPMSLLTPSRLLLSRLPARSATTMAADSGRLRTKRGFVSKRSA